MADPSSEPEITRYSVKLFGGEQPLPAHIEKAIKETEENLTDLLRSWGYQDVQVEFNREPLV